GAPGVQVGARIGTPVDDEPDPTLRGPAGAAVSGYRASRSAISSEGGRWPGAFGWPRFCAFCAERRYTTIVRTAWGWAMPLARTRISTALAFASSSRSSWALRSSAIDTPDVGS